MEPIVSGIEGVGPDAVERAMAAPVAKLRQAGERRAGKPAARRRVRVAEGIYRDRHGLATTVKVNGVQREVRFPPGTPLNTIRAKRDELRASLRTLPAAGRHTLNHDAGRYLDQVESTLVSFGDGRRASSEADLAPSTAALCPAATRARRAGGSETQRRGGGGRMQRRCLDRPRWFPRPAARPLPAGQLPAGIPVNMGGRS